MTAAEPVRAKLGRASAAIGRDRYHVELRARLLDVAERTPVTRAIKQGLPIVTSAA